MPGSCRKLHQAEHIYQERVYAKYLPQQKRGKGMVFRCWRACMLNALIHLAR